MATKGDLTRDRLLDTAVREASMLGLEGLSIGGLARDAEMSKSGVFAHFGSKEELQIAVLGAARERFIREVLQPAFTQPRGEPRLRALFERWLDWQEGKVTPGGCPILVASYEFDDRPGPVRDEIARLQTELLGALARAAQLAVETGHFRADVDARQIAYELHGIVLSYHLQHRLLKSADGRTRARTAFESVLSGARAS
jgi:AcrR family transcriptional regulator